MFNSFGRQCKPGWGFDILWNRLIPVEGEPPNVTSQIESRWNYDLGEFISTDIDYLVSFLFVN